MYDLPDGTVIQVDHKIRYSSTEIMFKPEVAKLTGQSIPAMIVDSIKKCPKLMRNVRLFHLSILGSISKYCLNWRIDID
jgi:hypothetical protein